MISNCGEGMNKQRDRETTENLLITGGLGEQYENKNKECSGKEQRTMRNPTVLFFIQPAGSNRQ
jgi:predicted nucleic acid-binding Zn ribbon protein